jgi:hypothetical protein
MPNKHAEPQWFAAALLLIAFLTIGCQHSRAQTTDIPMSTVMDAIHKYSQGYAPPTGSYKPLDFPPPHHYEAIEAVFAPFLKTQLKQERFDELEYVAGQARAQKSKHAGGVSVIWNFYEALASPLKQAPAPPNWDDHIASLKKWVATYPESATARISLANCYIARAWVARGHDFADKVDESSWNAFALYNNLAMSTLLEAAPLKDKDPNWFAEMQQLALAEGWTKAQARDLFEHATAFDPDYYHYYRNYTVYLLPRWHGEEGDMEAFAEEMPKRLKEPIASIMYFYIVSTYACGCVEDEPTLYGASWPRLKEGYSNVARLYAPSSLMINRYAYLAYLAKDKSAAHEIFSQLDDNAYNYLVWVDRPQYESARAWALAP